MTREREKKEPKETNKGRETNGGINFPREKRIEGERGKNLSADFPSRRDRLIGHLGAHMICVSHIRDGGQGQGREGRGCD